MKVHNTHKMIKWDLHGKVCSRCGIILDIHTGPWDGERLEKPCKG